MQRLTSILQEAMQNFHNSTADQSSAEWLTGYLRTHLEKREPDSIQSYSEEICVSIVIMEKKQAEMNDAIKRGVSAGSWAANDLAGNGLSNGAAAKESAEFLNGLMTAQDAEAEIIDTEATEWSDDEWNDFKLKDALKSVAEEAGRAVLKEIGAELFSDAADEGSAMLAEDAVPEDITDSKTKNDLKVAVSAGLSVAEDQGVIPETDALSVAALAHRAVEAASEIADTVSGKKTLTEALAHIKNNAAATVCAIWEANKQRLADAVGTAASLAGKAVLGTLAGKVFGAAGAAVVGTVTGLLTSKKGRERLKKVVTEAGKAVWGFLTKERHLPLLNKRKTKAKNTALN